MSGCIDSPLTVIPPNHRSNGNQGPTHLQTLATEKLTLTKTVSSKTPVANDGASEQRPESDPFDGLLEDFDVEDEGDRQVEEEVVAVGAPRTIPDEYLHTDPAVGLTVDEVVQRRKVYGSNRMNEENRSHVKQFLLFFVGPIQFVMEVITAPTPCKMTQMADQSFVRRHAFSLVH